MERRKSEEVVLPPPSPPLCIVEERLEDCTVQLDGKLDQLERCLLNVLETLKIVYERAKNGEAWW